MRKAGSLDDELAEDDEAEREFELTLIDWSIQKTLKHISMSKQELQILQHMQQLQEQAKNDAQRSAPSTPGLPPPERRGPPKIWKVRDQLDLMGPIPANMQDQLKRIPGSAQLPPGVAQLPRGSQQMQITPNSIAASVDAIESRVRQRRDAREQVFRVSNPHTMSIEQWAEEEQRLGFLPTPQAPPRVRPANYVGEQHNNREQEEEDGLPVHERSDEDEETQDISLRNQREWDDWKDDHERGAGNTMK